MTGPCSSTPNKKGLKATLNDILLEYFTGMIFNNIPLFQAYFKKDIHTYNLSQLYIFMYTFV